VKGLGSPGVSIPPPATGSLQPEAIGAACGGNETAEAFENNGPHGGPAIRQAGTRVNVEQASKRVTWEPTRP